MVHHNEECVDNYAGDESLSVKLIEVGISKELLQVEHPDFQQQAMDIVVLLLGQGDIPSAVYNNVMKVFFQISVWRLYSKMGRC